jgi:hypothetical protein
MNALYRGLAVAGALALVAFYPVTKDAARRRHDAR